MKINKTRKCKFIGNIGIGSSDVRKNESISKFEIQPIAQYVIEFAHMLAIPVDD